MKEALERKEQEIIMKEGVIDDLFCSNIVLETEAKEREEKIAKLEQEVQSLKAYNDFLLESANVQSRELQEKK